MCRCGNLTRWKIAFNNGVTDRIRRQACTDRPPSRHIHITIGLGEFLPALMVGRGINPSTRNTLRATSIVGIYPGGHARSCCIISRHRTGDFLPGICFVPDRSIDDRYVTAVFTRDSRQRHILQDGRGIARVQQRQTPNRYQNMFFLTPAHHDLPIHCSHAKKSREPTSLTSTHRPVILCRCLIKLDGESAPPCTSKEPLLDSEVLKKSACPPRNVR